MTTEFSAEELKVIEKIEKLLALSQSSNEHEAKLAAEKAAELLTIYNLTVEQIIDREKEYIILNCFDRDKANLKDKFIGHIITNFFFVRYILLRHYDFIEHKVITSIQLIGTKANTKVAGFVLAFLNQKFPELFDQYKVKTNCAGSARQSYYQGLSDGLEIQLTEARKRAESKTALMVIKDKKLNDFVSKQYNDRYSSPIDIRDRMARDAGREDGKALKIGRGLESNSVATERGRLLK